MKANFSNIAALTLLLAASAAISSCGEADDFDYAKDGIFVTGTESDPLTKMVVEDTPSSYAVTIQTTKKATSNVHATLAIDNALVDTYNELHNTTFFAAPDGAVVLDNPEVTINAGAALSSAATVRVVSTENFEDGRTYVVPVTIKSVSGATSEEVIASSKTIYLKISRIIQFTALDNDASASSNFIFDDSKIATLTNFTYEIKVFSYGFGRGGNIKRVGAWEEKDESNASMLRFGENGYDGNQLQWVSPAGSVMSNTRFQTRRWYMVSLVYDGSAMTMYVDGVKDASVSASGKTVKFQRFELGMSWGGYCSGQFFSGRMCENRVWNRALTPTEITNGLCGVDPHSDGLVAYWKFNEGSGHIFTDATGNGYDMDWSKTSRDISENGVMTATPSAANSIRFVNDNENKCAQ